jgi:hypothetical protein
MISQLERGKKMKENLEIIEKKITSAEEAYKKISNAWLSAEEVRDRIESLLVLARELRAAERN